MLSLQFRSLSEKNQYLRAAGSYCKPTGAGFVENRQFFGLIWLLILKNTDVIKT
jgi:hypothetical protein